MIGNKSIVITVIFILILAGIIGIAYVGFSSSNVDNTDPNNSGQNGTSVKQSGTTQVGKLEENSEWELIVSENETFVDGETGYGTADIPFPINSVNRLNIKIHVISELCTSCGGTGKGEVTVFIRMPSGELAFQNVYTQSADINLLQNQPMEGEWQIVIEGVAVGDAYRIGHSTQVFTSSLTGE